MLVIRTCSAALLGLFLLAFSSCIAASKGEGSSSRRNAPKSDFPLTGLLASKAHTSGWNNEKDAATAYDSQYKITKLTAEQKERWRKASESQKASKDSKGNVKGKK